MLKEGVDYRVKVSFKVRRVPGAVCPHTAGSLPQGGLVTLGPCPRILDSLPQVVSDPHGSLFPHVPAPQGPSCHPHVP